MIMNINLSDLYQFKKCPLQFKLTKIDKISDTLNSNDGLREAIQTTINYFFYHLQDGILLSFEEIKEKFASIWYGDIDLYEIQTGGRVDRRNKELEAIEMLQRLYRKQKRNPDKIFAVNLDFRVPFTDNLVVQDNIPIVRETNNGYEIVNYKTGRQSYDEFWQKTDMGLTLQAMAFESMFKKQAPIIVENLRTGKTVTVYRKREDYQRLYKSIKMMSKAMDEGWYYPNESFLCKNCTVKNICMEWK